ncbi:glucose-1-phosphate adenylyltransferase [Fimbriiglobus ruber]|uniref:Glucose-1-phosphate adenylyltransferase n=1 Tax=Fimbriiglobus ruber TaxID=1908690 RepID=A0A225EE13_9BACT|nr:glucose-1-phosphate adenylyltransferase [Fimbriiglobus ruber]OWK46635.1 Glucose-1-phosphate adenylyltransferase [Fimbriiglobus ruber]
MPRNVLTLILAGGKGTRLEPLTRDRAKPAVPFGGLYRIIDFTLSNCINSGLRKVFVVTQFKSRSLDRHIRLGWNFLSPELDEWIEVLPPQQRIDEHWYKGTADALYQNIYSIEKDDPEYLLVLAGDHIYRMDYAKMLDAHIAARADMTIGCIPVPVSESRHFGIMETDTDSRVVGFLEKPPTAAAMPDVPGHALGSMGIYVFNARALFELLCEDAARPDSGHDFGKDIIPGMIATGHRVFAYRFRDDDNKPIPYWRDVGTLDALYQANLDLVGMEPALNLYDREHPIRTLQPQSPPPKFVHAAEGQPGRVRRGEALDSIVSPGCIISGGHVRNSVLSPHVRVNSYAVVEDSILFEGVDVGRYCHVRRAIIDKDVKLPPYTVIGHDREFDLKRGFTITEQGIVVVPKSEPPENFQAPNRLPD